MKKELRILYILAINIIARAQNLVINNIMVNPLEKMVHSKSINLNRIDISLFIRSMYFSKIKTDAENTIKKIITN
ncbi:hypothetical protein C8N46_103335 [Kordia periserrulae]|uniref:Uncharacterized protein n=1 Tax=Kordia periserrulae TaxID=701523 RepID=A0A2T6C1Q1_9FLAO|nr:hypothetical protein C8N46_103335 [Kordia periserrulae]